MRKSFEKFSKIKSVNTCLGVKCTYILFYCSVFLFIDCYLDRQILLELELYSFDYDYSFNFTFTFVFPSVVVIGWYWTFDWVVTVFGWCCAILAGGDFLNIINRI